MDRSYITQDEFKELYEKAREIIVMLQKLIDDLENSDYKGVMYKSRSITRELANK